jgi:hypothetical protein
VAAKEKTKAGEKDELGREGIFLVEACYLAMLKCSKACRFLPSDKHPAIDSATSASLALSATHNARKVGSSDTHAAVKFFPTFTSMDSPY